MSDSPHARRFDLCGDHKAAIVLERLTYWWLRGTRILHGTEWRAKPRSQLASECRLSPKETRTALELLKAKSLIETSRHRFGAGQEAYMHYRLLPRAMTLIPGREGDPGDAPAMAPQGQSLDHMAGMDPKISYVSSNEETTDLLVANGFPSEGVSGKAESMVEGVSVNTKFQGHSLPKPGNTPKAPSKPGKSAGKSKPGFTDKLGMSAAELIASKSKSGVFPGMMA